MSEPGTRFMTVRKHLGLIWRAEVGNHPPNGCCYKFKDHGVAVAYGLSYESAFNRGIKASKKFDGIETVVETGWL